MPLFDIFKRKQETRSQNTNENAHLEVENPCITTDLGVLNGLFNKISDPMHLSAVFAAIQMISNSVATMPVHVKKIDDSEIKFDDFVPRMFRKSRLTKFMTMKNLVRDMLVRGNGYAYIVRGDNGKPEKLQYLTPELVTVFYNPTTLEIQYYTSSIMPKKQINPQDMIHVMINSHDGVMGKGILDFATDVIDSAGYADKTASNFFKGGGQTNGILTMNIENPNLNIQPKKIEDIKSAWRNGATKAEDGTTVRIIPSNMKYQSVQSNPNESQMLQTRVFNIQEIARYFNISPILLGDLSKNMYNSVEQAQLEYVLHCLAPYIELIQDEFTRKLIDEVMQDHLYIDLDETYLIKGDKQSFANYLNTLSTSGILTKNECRVALGYEPVDDELANKLMIAYTDVNQNTVGDTEEEDKEQETEQKDQETEDESN